MAKTQSDATATEQTEDVKYKTVSAKVTEREHFMFTTYAKVKDVNAGELAASIIRDWLTANVDQDELRKAVLEQLGL